MAAAPTAKPAGGAKQPQTFAAQPAAVKVMLAVFIVAILGAIYYFALHTPMEEAISNEQGRFSQLQNQMREAEERQREFIRLREEVASREGLDRANMRVLPEQAEIAAFLQDLNRLAETSGLQMRLVEPRPEEPDTHYVRLPVALGVRGRYHQLARFFYNVSRLERAISMENIELTEPTLAGEDVVLDVGVLATTYRRPTAPPPAPDGAAAAPQGG
ncbi:type 4a pilus biogenesis protein PilO [Sandaracinus amylolyticus]|uniref:type 4a pilus biogenesis protein PilO n=1 Tax=Sandaracinus amylolyticus TaxID=927083 RepID=UPI001F247846|nr:type 4a pilus biogenesis protein PilO [Sandaracinus amylolyticus]UJR79047.1 Type IV pilus biogenesis protein PilO [Sandaracinus amylolyticus]